VLLPPRSFSATGNEAISLTLQSFSIRRNWYNINATNNTGYIYEINNTSAFEFQITPGVYTSFTALKTAIEAALDACIAANSQLSVWLTAATVAYDSTTRLFTISLTKDGSYTNRQFQIRCFAIKGAPPAGVSQQGGFNDLYEILGGSPLRSATATGASLEITSSAGAAVEVLRSRYPAALNTLDAIYIHLPTLETGNFMSTGHESHVVDSLRLIESSIFARIPFDDSTFTEAHEVIQFEDNGGDAFQSMMTRKSLENLDIRVTDAKGRSLASVGEDQANLGLMAFKMAIRYDVFIPPQPKEPSHGVLLKASHPPTVTHS